MYSQPAQQFKKRDTKEIGLSLHLSLSLSPSCLSLPPLLSYKIINLTVLTLIFLDLSFKRSSNSTLLWVGAFDTWKLAVLGQVS
jgi:hypothetical protein